MVKNVFTLKCKIDGALVEVTLEDGTTLLLTHSAAQQIAHMSDLIHYKQDVIKYFNDNADTYNVRALMEDESLINRILSKYDDLRTDAEDSWWECLEQAVRAHKKSLGKYRKTKRLHIAAGYTFTGDTGIDIPVELIEGKKEEEQLRIAYEYAKDHVAEIPTAANATYVSDSDTFGLEDVDWEES